VIEIRTREYVEARIRAGVLEQVMVDLLRDAGVANRLDRASLTHDGFELAFGRRAHRIDIAALTGKRVRFSWWFTRLTHKFSDDPFAYRLH
jgi:p-hydroxybenzoate 3-monooxygenase